MKTKFLYIAVFLICTVLMLVPINTVFFRSSILSRWFDTRINVDAAYRNKLVNISPHAIPKSTEINLIEMNYGISVDQITELESGDIEVILENGEIYYYRYNDGVIGFQDIFSFSAADSVYRRNNGEMILVVTSSDGEIISYRIYDVNSGKLLHRYEVDQITEKYEGLKTNSIGGDLIGSPPLFLECTPISCVSESLHANESIFIAKAELSNQISAMLTYPQSPSIVLALENQQLEIIRMDKNFKFHRPYYIVLGEKCDDCSVQTIDLAISEYGKWIGQLTDESIIVWDLEKLWNKKTKSIEVSGGNFVEFNPVENVMAVAFDDEIKFFNPKTGKELHSISTNSSVTVMSFDSNNRLFVWGDEAGYLHIWGIPEK